MIIYLVIKILKQIQAPREPRYAVWIIKCLHLPLNLNNHLRDYDYYFYNRWITVILTGPRQSGRKKKPPG